MKKIIGLLFALILLSDIGMATEYINVKNVNIDSFGGLVEAKDEIYVSSIIKYNISLESETTNSEIQRFNVVIINPSKEVIENSTFTFDINNSQFIIRSNISDTEWKLIYADVSGIYKLILSSYKHQLFENKTTSPISFHRHDYSLPFYFEVKSLQEKRLSDANEQLIKRNEEITTQSGEINTQILTYTEDTHKYTRNMYFASLAMLLVSVVTLFSTPNGRNTIWNIAKNCIIAIGLFLIVILLLIFFLQYL